MSSIKKENIFSSWLSVIIEASEHPFIKSSPDMINSFFELDNLIPNKYEWRYNDIESFKKLMTTAGSDINKLQRVFWIDIASLMEAYSIMTCMRMNEVLRSTIRSLNNTEIVSASILSRSCIELASAILENANVFDSTIANLPQDKQAVVITDSEFEALLNKTIWGTRYGDKIPEDLKQKNILTIIQRLSKHPNAKDLPHKYEFLCELAHPNVIGNTRFWSDESRANEDGSVTIVIRKDGYSNSQKETIETVLWALGWSAACVRSGFQLIREVISAIDKRFDLNLILK